MKAGKNKNGIAAKTAGGRRSGKPDLRLLKLKGGILKC
jgi:hypothetical protein